MAGEMASTPPPMPGLPEDVHVGGDASVWLRIAVSAVIGVVTVAVVVPRIADVDWASVGEALGALGPVEVAAVVGCWCVMLVTGGALLAVAAPGVSARRGAALYVVSLAVSASVPGPSDLAARFALLRAWGADRRWASVLVTTMGAVSVGNKIGLSMFAALGLALSDPITGAPDRALQLSLLVVVGFVVLHVVVFSLLRSSAATARVVGGVEGFVGAVARRVGRPGPAEWVPWVESVRGDVYAILWRRFFACYGVAIIDLVAEAGTLLVVIRLLGVPDDVLGWELVVAAYALVQVLTAVPITAGSVGVADLAYAGLLTGWTDAAWHDELVAAAMLYRVVTWLLPIPIGWTLFAVARRRAPGSGAPLEAQSVERVR